MDSDSNILTYKAYGKEEFQTEWNLIVDGGNWLEFNQQTLVFSGTPPKELLDKNY